MLILSNTLKKGLGILGVVEKIKRRPPTYENFILISRRSFICLKPLHPKIAKMVKSAEVHGHS
jgi:hypothetical protein